MGREESVESIIKKIREDTIKIEKKREREKEKTKEG
jgi:hypothetical protein